MNYIIIDSSEIPSVDFNSVLNTNADLLRYNLDKTQAVLKYEGDQPSFLKGKTEYTHSEILARLDAPEWSDPDPLA
jgi:hypothetical protein